MLINKKEEKILFILVERNIDISQSICIYCIVVKEFWNLELSSCLGVAALK